MTIAKPTLHQMRGVSDELGLEMTDADLSEFIGLMDPHVDILNWIESEPDFVPEIRWPRTPGYVPQGDDNEFNAWARKVSVTGAPDGPLKGRKVALKDNVSLAGVPMMNGASTLAFHTPRLDATVVTRILDAGGEIVGKAQCEFFSLTGNSHSNYSRHKVQNPHKPGHTPGGSSSGCGALVGGGVVDMAIGGDQGGRSVSPPPGRDVLA